MPLQFHIEDEQEVANDSERAACCTNEVPPDGSL
jgi:hypothetical protein